MFIHAPSAAFNLINLQSLIDLSAALNASDDNTFILNSSLLSVMGKLRTFKACAFVPHHDSTPELALWAQAASKGITVPESALTLDERTQQSLTISLTQPVISSTGDESRHIAMLCFGTKLDKTPYSDEEQQYISLVASITANALANAENMRSLRKTGAFLERKNQLLTTLFEINREFSTLLDKAEITKFLSLRLMGQLAVTRFAMLSKTARGDFEAASNRLGITPEQLAALNSAYRIDNSNTGDDNEQNEETDINERCAALIEGCSMLIPMNVQNETKGLLLVGGKMNKQPFRAEEKQFLEALASTAMTALENARLFHEELEKKRLEDELNLAHQIQQGLLPTELPHVEGFDLAAVSISSKQVGGDYYDVIAVDTDDGSGAKEYVIVIADVSGKGAPAALLMANTQAALRVLSPLRLPLPEMVSRLNDMLFTNTSSDKFVTFFCLRLNPATRSITFVNGGHNPPLLLHADGSLELLSEGGLVLGIMETLVPYEEKTLSLQTGDVILMYTDGVSEALNPASQEFSEQATETSFRRSTPLPAQEIIATIHADVEHHANGAPQSDDITMVVLKCV